ncbi:MAG TPA: tetratricopeptide repeat protein [Tepidisphaeraceae bacterium]
MWKWLLIPMMALAATVRAADEYLPLVPGATWHLRLTTTANGKESVTQRKLTAKADPHGVALEGLVYAPKADGVYVLGRYGSDGTFQPFDDPQKQIPTQPKLGDKWEYRDAFGRHSQACLGVEAIKVPAGDFQAVKVYSVAVGGKDGADRVETYRWYAPGVGLVRSTTHQRKAQPDGSVAQTDSVKELLSYDIPKSDVAATNAEHGHAAAASVDAIFEQAQALARQGRHRDAIAKYDAALAIDPKAAKVHAYKAISLMASREFDAAQSEVDRARSLDDHDYTFVEIAGQLRLMQGKLPEGQALYDKAAAMSPGNAGAVYTDLAAVLAARNDERLAGSIDQALKRAASADPPSAEALFALGQSYVNAGRSEGKDYLRRYIEVASKLPDGKRDDRKIRLARQLIRAIDAVKGGP